MPKKVDLLNQRFGKLLVLEQTENIRGRIGWLCICDCGKNTSIDSNSLRSGNTTSCGCVKAERNKTFRKTHGMSKTRTYTIWCGIIDRCFNKNEPRYIDYGERGISMCNTWRNSFETFLSDMGEAPDGMSIDRINNEKGYSKDNCKWSTPTEQAKNTRRNRMITFNGETMCINDWAKKIGICEATLRCRFDRFNWSIEKSLTTPAGKSYAR